MAKPGVASQLGRAGADSSATRAALTEAAILALREEGFGGASARVIARNADVNQALVFYHFGSVVNLLLSALDETSRRRMDEYSEAVDGAAGIAELVDTAASIFQKDLDQGHMSVLAAMISGASSVDGLGEEVSRRIAPWIAFTEESISRVIGEPLSSVVPTADIAYAVVALYLGIEMLAHLDGDRARAEALFATAKRLVGLMTALTGGEQPPAAKKGAGNDRYRA